MTPRSIIAAVLFIFIAIGLPTVLGIWDNRKNSSPEEMDNAMIETGEPAYKMLPAGKRIRFIYDSGLHYLNSKGRDTSTCWAEIPCDSAALYDWHIKEISKLQKARLWKSHVHKLGAFSSGHYFEKGGKGYNVINGVCYICNKSISDTSLVNDAKTREMIRLDSVWQSYLEAQHDTTGVWYDSSKPIRRAAIILPRHWNNFDTANPRYKHMIDSINKRYQ